MRTGDAPYYRLLKGPPLRLRIAAEGTRTVRLNTPGGPRVLKVERVPGAVTPAAVADLQLRHRDGALLLLAPYVGPEAVAALVAANINFVDLAGNAHLALEPNYYVHVEGRRPLRARRGERGLGAPGFRLLFALVVRPDLLNEPVRAIAAAAGVSKTQVAHALANVLEKDGTIGRTQHGRMLLDRPRTTTRWVAGYADLLRPRLVLGRFRTQEQDPAALDEVLAEALEETQGVLGGGAAAYRLTRYYRGETTVVHATEMTRELTRRLRAVPDDGGNLIVMAPPGPLALAGPKPGVAHPLLVYAELLAAGDERAREAAMQVREQYGDGW